MHDETSNTWLHSMKGAHAEASGWRYLLDSYGDFVRNILIRKGLDETSADDVTQNVMTIVSKKIGEFERERPGSFRTWLRNITVNCLRDFFKSKQYRSRAVGGTEIFDMAAAIEDSNSEFTELWNRQHAAHVVEELLKAVTPEFTPKTIEIFRRLALENESVETVSRDLKMAKNSCVVARSRVFRRLRVVADDLFADEDGLFDVN